MNAPIYLASILISFLASFTVYLNKEPKLYLRLFPLFLLLTVVVEFSGFYLVKTKEPRIILYSIFTSIEFFFYLYILREIIENQRVKRLILYVIGVYVILLLLNFFFIQNIAAFKSITYAIGSLLIVVCCIYYIYEIFQLSHSVNLARQPAFWICCGLLFYYCCSFPIMGVLNFMSNLSPTFIKSLGLIMFLLNVFLYSSFTIAFLCRLRTRKSIS